MGVITNLLDQKLIADWRCALRMHILQLHLAITAVFAAIYNLAKAYPDLAQQLLTHVPPALTRPWIVNTVLALWLVLGAYARLVPQPPKE